MVAKRIAFIIGGVALAGALLWSIRTGPLWVRESGTPMPPSSPASDTSATSSGEAKVVVSPGIDIDYEYATQTPAMPERETTLSASAPSLNRTIVIPASFSPADASLIKESIAKLVESIKKSPENGALWAEFGLKRKGIEDYEGAKEAYEYALKLMPNNAMVADSLGVIYGDYLKDYTKAVRYFRLAIDIDPSANYRYMRLFELYRYALKDNGKAKAILEEGLRAIPNEPSFQALLETVK